MQPLAELTSEGASVLLLLLATPLCVLVALCMGVWWGGTWGNAPNGMARLRRRCFWGAAASLVVGVIVALLDFPSANVLWVFALALGTLAVATSCAALFCLVLVPELRRPSTLAMAALLVVGAPAALGSAVLPRQVTLAFAFAVAIGFELTVAYAAGRTPPPTETSPRTDDP